MAACDDTVLDVVPPEHPGDTEVLLALGSDEAVAMQLGQLYVMLESVADGPPRPAVLLARGGHVLEAHPAGSTDLELRIVAERPLRVVCTAPVETWRDVVSFLKTMRATPAARHDYFEGEHKGVFHILVVSCFETSS
ncbi:MAG TPA: hypothetical protein VD971_07020 [Phycisphaerales bacterium]|nr:hypothetical protein [Phycisphaerales bacterium]